MFKFGRKSKTKRIICIVFFCISFWTLEGKKKDYSEITQAIDAIEGLSSTERLDSLKYWEATIVKEGNELDKVYYYIFLAKNFDYSGDIQGALASIKRSQELLVNIPKEVVREHSLEARHMQIFGNIYWSTKDYSQALNYYEKALSLLGENEKFLLKSALLSNTSSIYFLLGKTDTAFAYAFKALNYTRQHGDTLNVISDLYNLGVKYMSIGEFEVANAYFDSTLFMARDVYSKKYIGMAIQGQADVDFWLDKFDDAIVKYKKAISLFEELGLVRNLAYLYGNLSDVYFFKNDFEGAYNYLDLAKTYEDSIYKIEKADAISRLQVEFDTRQKEKDLEIANLELENQVQTNKAVTATRNYLIVGILLIIVASWGFVTYYRQKQRLAQQQVELSHQEIDDLITQHEIKVLDALNDGQDKERQRLARDLHDRMGSLLVSMKMNFENLRTATDKRSIEVYQHTHKLINEAIEEVRKVSHNLASQSVNEFGLMPALEELKNSLETSNAMDIELKGYGLEQRLPMNVEVEIYRIIQEIVSNALKHSTASSLSINLNKGDNEFTLIVEDNGKGFDLQKEHKGIGLRNMKARADNINAKLHFDSHPSHGTTIILNMELEWPEKKAM